MWSEAVKVAIVGFSVVFITLAILAIGVKVMSFCCNLGRKKGGK
jgi:Na+-transporting methylmalonyl-CoA/oxaloacetate decarboxylase gamma subunit